jgi:hypothetical protein
MYNVTLRRVRITIVAVKKAISITYSECLFVALVIQHAKSMRHIILLSVACLILSYFSTLSDKRHDTQKSLLNVTLCLDFLYKCF